MTCRCEGVWFAPSRSRCAEAGQLQSSAAVCAVQLAGLLEQHVVSWDGAERGNAADQTHRRLHLVFILFGFDLVSPGNERCPSPALCVWLVSASLHQWLAVLKTINFPLVFIKISG